LRRFWQPGSSCFTYILDELVDKCLMVGGIDLPLHHLGGDLQSHIPDLVLDLVYGLFTLLGNVGLSLVLDLHRLSLGSPDNFFAAGVGGLLSVGQDLAGLGFGLGHIFLILRLDGFCLLTGLLGVPDLGICGGLAL